MTGSDPTQLSHLVSYQLKRAFLGSHAAYAAALIPLGLAPGHYAILAAASEQEGLIQKELAATIGLDQSTIVPLLNTLVQRNWIERRAGVDRRARRLFLTPEGKKALSELRPVIAKHEARVSAGLTRQEKNNLLRLLQRIRENVEIL
jgi:DNA-binding MarR family transcriptional regulator